MSGEKNRVDGYLGTVGRLEPDIHPIDASAFYASAAISLKRIADALEERQETKAGFWKIKMPDGSIIQADGKGTVLKEAPAAE